MPPSPSSQFPNYLTAPDGPSPSELPIEVVDWFWRRAVTTMLDDSSTLFISTSSRVLGGHCVGWLKTARVIVAYTGPDSIKDVSSATEAAVKDVAPEEFFPFPLSQARLALQDGEPSWVPLKSRDALRHREEAEERKVERARAQTAKEEGGRAVALKRKREEAADAKRKALEEKAEARRLERAAKAKGKAKKPYISEYLRQQSEEESAAWDAMLHQVRKAKPGASQQEIDAEMAKAMGASFEDTELRRPPQPSASTLQQPASDIEATGSQSLFPSEPRGVFGEEPLTQGSEVAAIPRPETHPATSSRTAIQGLQQRLDIAAQEEVESETELPPVTHAFRSPSSKPAPLRPHGLTKPKSSGK